MSSNKRAKELLIARYGEIDFMEELKVAPPPSTKYKSKGLKKRMQQLSYHHIVQRKDGGKATIENGALLTLENHAYFHNALSPEEQRKLNNAFQELKRRKDNMQEVDIVYSDDFEMPLELNVVEMEIDRRGKLKGYQRAKVKCETRKEIEEYEMV